jgi:serine/threonine protein kinase
MPKVIDKYILEEKIGNGQFGEVYKGIHQETLEVVAIKTIRRDMIKGNYHLKKENSMNYLKIKSRF